MSNKENKTLNAFTIKPDISDWVNKQRIDTIKRKGGFSSKLNTNNSIILFTKSICKNSK